MQGFQCLCNYNGCRFILIFKYDIHQLATFSDFVKVAGDFSQFIWSKICQSVWRRINSIFGFILVRKFVIKWSLDFILYLTTLPPKGSPVNSPLGLYSAWRYLDKNHSAGVGRIKILSAWNHRKIRSVDNHYENDRKKSFPRTQYIERFIAMVKI